MQLLNTRVKWQPHTNAPKPLFYRSVSIGNRGTADLRRDIRVARRLLVVSRGLVTDLCNMLMKPCDNLFQLFDLHIPSLDRFVSLLEKLVNMFLLGGSPANQPS
jgi:hypothetical protein